MIPSSSTVSGWTLTASNRYVDVRHKLFVIGEEVVRREQRNDRVWRLRRDAQQGIKNCGRCSLVHWLFEQETWRNLIRERLIELAMFLRDDDRRAAGVRQITRLVVSSDRAA